MKQQKVTDNSCKYCSPHDNCCCRALHPGGVYECTRKPGHKGLHIACGLTEGNHPIVAWRQRNAKT